MSVSVILGEDLHRMRLELAVLKAGKLTLLTVFSWTYQGGSCIKSHLINDLHYSLSQFKDVFDQYQRKIVEANDIDSADVTLLYKLLQRVCGLADKNDPVWTTLGPDGPSLEHLIFKLKQHRNKLAHENKKLTENDLTTKLMELRDLMTDILIKAGDQCNKGADDIEDVTREVTTYIDGLQNKIREPLDLSDIALLQQLRLELNMFRETLRDQVKQRTKEEVTAVYRLLYKIVPAPWLLLNITHDPNLTFTRLRLHVDEIIGSRPSQKVEHQDIEYEDMFKIKREDGSVPQCLILTGEGGMGKTTLLKLILQMWVENTPDIHGLDSVDLVLYVQCRDRHLRTFDDLLHHQLHLTHLEFDLDFPHFKKIILSLNLLVMIDGYDEVNDNSATLVSDLLNLPGKNLRVIITTRPGWDVQLSQLVPQTKPLMNMLVLGITPDLHSVYADRIINMLVHEDSKQRDIKLRFKQRVEEMGEFLGEYLNTPLTLTLLALLCVEAPSEFNKLTTNTQVFELILRFITSKLVSRLTAKQVTNPKAKCNKFLSYFEEVCLRGIKRKEYELMPETEQDMRAKCDSLELPQEEVLSSYFNRTRSRQDLELVLQLGYFHSRYQEHCASRGLITRLLKSDEEGGRNQPEEGPGTTNLVQDILLDRRDTNLKLLNESRYQSILLSATGLLSARKLEDRFAPQVIQLVKCEAKVWAEVDNLLKHVAESNYSEHIIQAVCEQLSKFTRWKIDSDGHGTALPRVLEHVTPNDIFLDISTIPKLCQLQPILTMLSKATVNVNLSLNQHYFDRTGAHDDVFLQTLTSPSSKCTLLSLRGKLSPEAIPSLPASLTGLHLQVTLEELLVLMNQFPCLPHIKHLGIIVDATGHVDKQPLPSIPYSDVLLRLRIVRGLTDEDPDLDWLCDMVRQLCPQSQHGHFYRLGFDDTQLTSAGVRGLVKELHQRGITTSELLVWLADTSSVEGEDSKIKELAESLGIKGLRMFHWRLKYNVGNIRVTP